LATAEYDNNIFFGTSNEVVALRDARHQRRTPRHGRRA